ncbi:isopeptide-forming domain-containing fimbrial protein [Bifidobacterium aquikefiri]|uniref:isopeptide-forming domain-containing fimbrial protein n=1 Tax=Bifidobacterium aquikefiri TaxID=1653207 RepID=UPI0039E99E5E
MLVFAPVERASADSVELGPDGYFSTLADGEMPMRSFTSVEQARAILFGVSGNAVTNPAKTVGVSGVKNNVTIDGRYVVLAKGPNTTTANRSPLTTNIATDGSWSHTTPVAAGEALLWADDVVTDDFDFNNLSYGPNWFETETTMSYLAQVSQVMDGDTYYSSFERSQFGAAQQLNAVCVVTAGCKDVSAAVQGISKSTYRVFPLSLGDMAEYFNANDGRISADDAKRRCSDVAKAQCNNDVSGSQMGFWLRSSQWLNGTQVYLMDDSGSIHTTFVSFNHALRPALRLQLDRLLLSAKSTDQSQNLQPPSVGTSQPLRLTFVDEGKRVSLSKKPYLAESAGVWRVTDLEGSSDLDDQSGLGWKIVDPEDDTGVVVASGRTNYDAAAKSDGNMVVPCAALTVGKKYDFYAWGQQDGSDTVGWSNRATEPVKGVVTKNADGTCSLKVKTLPSYGIDVTGMTSGGLTAYRIGEYSDVTFDRTGALQSVKVSTPSGVETVVAAAAGVAGGSNVDAANPMGWVAATWLGYPTDPLSDDTTSAFDPYAGQLQLFARALEADVGSLGSAAGSLPAGTFSSGGTVTLPVPGPGLYLIVDDSGDSLPIIVGSKAFNEDLSDGVMVDFADAGVNGKHRLGVAELKTMRMELSKRIINDGGVDGFDVGGSVEFEIAVKVPDLTGYTSTGYSSYEFSLSDVAAAGLTLPDASGVRVLMDVDPSTGVSAPNTDVTSQVSVAVSGQTLTVDELKALFAQNASPVENKTTVPAGSLVRVRYAAVVNENAEWTDAEGTVESNDNTVTLTKTQSDGNVDTSVSATARVYSFVLNMVKVDKDHTSTFLPGAEFEASRSKADGSGTETLEFMGQGAGSGVYRLAVSGDTGATTTLITGTNGRLALQGVEARAITLKETKAPDDYFGMPNVGVGAVAVWTPTLSDVQVVSYRTSGSVLASVSSDGSTIMLADPSVSLMNLPYTGGVGIMILLTLGVSITILAIRPYYLSHCAEATANLI